MPIKASTIEGGPVMEVTVSGELHKEDYDVFVPQLEKVIERHGKLRLLFNMHDFHGWDPAALWEDLKLDAKHLNHFERVAMVGEKKWERALAALCRPLTIGTVKYFDRAQEVEAKQWLLAEE